MTTVQNHSAGPQPGSARPPRPANGLAIATFVLGIVAIVVSPVPVVDVLGILVALVGTGLGIPAVIVAARHGVRLVFAVIGLSLSFVALIASVAFVGHYATTVLAPSRVAVAPAAPVSAPSSADISAGAAAAAANETPDPVAPDPVASDPVPAGPKTFTFTVGGTAHAARVYYSLDGSSGGGDTVALPWSKQMTTTEQQFNTSMVSASTDMGTPGSVTCTITDGDGQVVAQRTASSQGGEFGSASVTCSG